MTSWQKNNFGMKVDCNIAKKTMTLFDTYKPWRTFPVTPWIYTHTGIMSNKVWEEDGCINVEIEMPGKSKSDIFLTFDPEKLMFTLKVGDREWDFHISRQVEIDKIDAQLNLGILSIRAPVKNTVKEIEVK